MDGVTARAETSGDYDAIDDVVRRAFNEETEVQLVHNIRASAGYIPDLALVATADDRVVAHLMVSDAELDDGETRHRIVMLSPVAVHPDFQRRSIGSLLIREVIARTDARGEPLLIVEGSPLYYPRFGFRHSVPLGITINLPEWAPAEAAMVVPLTKYRPELTGTVVYPPAFDLLD